MTGRLRLAVDIGGTFTDGVLIEDGTDRTWTHKVLTTPDDPSEGFIAVVDALLRTRPAAAADLVSVTHATTITTNTLLQRRGARTALLIDRRLRGPAGDRAPDPARAVRPPDQQAGAARPARAGATRSRSGSTTAAGS